MGYEFGVIEELLVTRSEIGTYAFEYEGHRESLVLTLEVISDDTLENKRSITGEIDLLAFDPNEKNPEKRPYEGYCIFYRENEFKVEMTMPMNIVERLWQISSSKPGWLMVSISDGPEIIEVAKTYEGKFRFRYRAGNDYPGVMHELRARRSGYDL